MMYILFSGVIVTMVLSTIQGKSLIICQNQDETVFCDKGVIKVTESIFGRTKSFWKCGFSFTLRTCHVDVTETVSHMCDDKASCTVKARKREFGNPCDFRLLKIYLNVTYECVEEMTTIPGTTIPDTTITTEQFTTPVETTQELIETTLNPVTKRKLSETNSTSRILSETDITGLRSQSEESTLGNATGPVIGFASGIFLIILIVLITLRQNKKKRYQCKNRQNSSSYLNKTYDSAIYKPRNNSTQISNSSQGCSKTTNPDYENIPSASSSSRPFFKNKIKPSHSKYSCAKSLNDDKGAIETALIHDLKQNCSAPMKQKKRLNQYVYTSVKNSEESSSSNKNNENKSLSGENNNFQKPKTALVPTNKKIPNQTSKDENFDFPKTKNVLVTSKGNECSKIKSKEASFRSGNKDPHQCDSYYLDMSVIDGKSKDIDIKYVTMNRNAKPLDDVSIHLYVNDMNSGSYCNIQIQNNDKKADAKCENKTGSDVHYDNLPRNKLQPRAMEESVYEPYYAE